MRKLITRAAAAHHEQVLRQVRSQARQQDRQLRNRTLHTTAFSCASCSIRFTMQACLNRCQERYMDVWNTVARIYAGRIQRESGLH